MTNGKKPEELNVANDLAKRLDGVLAELQQLRSHLDFQNKEVRAGLENTYSRLSELVGEVRAIQRDSSSSTRIMAQPVSGVPKPRARQAKPPWWLLILLGGALTYLGERGCQVLIQAMAK